MVPVGAIIAVVLLLLRGVSALQNKGEAGPTVMVSRGSATFAGDDGAGGTVVWQLILFSTWLGATAVSLTEPAPLLIALAVVSFVALFPWWVTRKLLVPLGLARLAYGCAWLSRVTWRRDKPGGPALAAAWALARQRRPSPKTLAWVEQKLGDTPRALQGSTLVATGFLAAARGEKGEARTWLEGVLQLDERVAPTVVRRLAGEWLATDAAARGDWARVKTIAADKRWTASRTLWLLEGLARRHLGEPLPSDAGLWLWWLLAPRRLSTHGFVKQTLRLPRRAPETPVGVPEAPPSLDASARALWQAVALAQRKDPVAREVELAARAWEAALGSEVRSRLFTRATLIGGGEPDATLEELRQLVEQDLGPRVPASGLSAGGEGHALLAGALQAQKDARFADLEERVTRLDERKKAKRELPAREEWREFTALRALYEALAAGADESDRALAYSITHDRLLNFAVWLYNDRLERPLANAVFRFLEREAAKYGSDEDRRIDTKNAKCDL